MVRDRPKDPQMSIIEEGYQTKLNSENSDKVQSLLRDDETEKQKKSSASHNAPDAKHHAISVSNLLAQDIALKNTMLKMDSSHKSLKIMQ